MGPAKENRNLIVPVTLFVFVMTIVIIFEILIEIGFSSEPDEVANCTAISHGTTLDWRDVGSDAEVELCLIILAKNLKTPQAMADWLTSQGFRVSPPYEGYNKVQTMVGAYWPIEKDSTFTPYGTWSNHAAQKTMVFLLSAILRFKLPSSPFSVTISYLKNGSLKADAGPNFL
jgi:hypothetical protein